MCGQDCKKKKNNPAVWISFNCTQNALSENIALLDNVGTFIITLMMNSCNISEKLEDIFYLCIYCF